MVKPNFMIVGSYGCGTTFTVNLLRQHPQIYMPTGKSQARYFEFYGIKETQTFEQYLQSFAGGEGKQAVGEKNTHYMVNEFVPKQLAYHFKDEIKLIFLLRNPLVRMYSAYWGQVNTNNERLSFENALKREPQRIQRSIGDRKRFGYIERSYYMRQINRFLPLFPPENLKFILSEDLFGHPTQTVGELFTFLGVDSQFELDLKVGQRHGQNASAPRKHYPKYPHLYFPLSQTYEQLKGRKLPGTHVFRRFLRQWPKTPVRPPPPPQAIRYAQSLLNEDILALSEFLKRDLSHWVQPVQ